MLFIFTDRVVGFSEHKPPAFRPTKIQTELTEGRETDGRPDPTEKALRAIPHATTRGTAR